MEKKGMGFCEVDVGCAQKICSLLLNRSKIHEFTSVINRPRRAFVNHHNIASW